MQRRLLARRWLLGAIVTSAVWWPATPTIAARQPGPSLLLTRAWLIDGTGAQAVQGAWIRIDGDRITAVGSGVPPQLPGAIVIDLDGKTVLPGLADMHVHLGPPDQARWMLKLLLAHGVTNVKETGNTLGNLAAIKAWARSDGLVPHLYTSGTIMNGSEADLQFLPAGRRLATMLEDNKALGADFLKIHNWVSSFAMRQISEFATANDLYLTGHVPLGMSSVSAIDGGLTILEHVRVHPYEVLDDVSVASRFPLDLVVMRRTGYWASFKPDGINVTHTLDQWEKRKDKFFLDPTLVVQEALAYADDPRFNNSPALRLISPAMRAEWPAAAKRYGDLTREEFIRAKGSVEGQTAFVRLAHRRGIRILTGTDTPVPFTVPGASLLRELEHLVTAGMTPIEAIRCSTGRAAEAFRTTERGTISAGRQADLVIVSGNAAENIANLTRIEKVILGGRVHDRADLLEQAARLAATQRSRTATAQK